MSDDSEIKQRSWFERLSAWLIREPQDREQLIEVLREAEERHLLSSEHLTMIESILQVSEMQVREIMVSKAQMIVAYDNQTLDELLPIVLESAHSRFPVIDHISGDVIGILLAKDMLKPAFAKDNQSGFNVKDIMRNAVFVPESKRLDVLLREFRVNRHHMAIVIDEYGFVSGLVTIEDVLEQIVGDIEDEYDIGDEEYVKKQEDGSFTLKASMPIEEFNEYFNTQLSTEEFDTIGG
ncbi:MAG TPA: CBS domain-containing protein, partial [Gammaproteobacteria bacterium]|nr:CBS domain-containing protein [Gammaproteobacteria bacterium]